MTGARISLSQAFAVNSIFLCAVGIIAFSPSISHFFWLQLGLPHMNRTVVSLFLALPLCLSILFAYLSTDASKEKVVQQLARFQMMWWIISAVGIVLLTKGGTLVIPIILVLTLIAGIFAVSIALNDNTPKLTAAVQSC